MVRNKISTTTVFNCFNVLLLSLLSIEIYSFSSDYFFEGIYLFQCINFCFPKCVCVYVCVYVAIDFVFLILLLHTVSLKWRNYTVCLTLSSFHKAHSHNACLVYISSIQRKKKQ